jgi:MarR family transcriptional regulator, organic hydroperoxide resistance regulator
MYHLLKIFQGERYRTQPVQYNQEMTEIQPTSKKADILTSTRVLMETLPLMMGFVTAEVRRQDPDKRFTLVQLRALNILKRRGSISLKELAEELGSKLPTASVLIVRLVKQKLVKRQTDKKERRKVVIQLTEQGETLIDSLNNSIFQQLSKQVQVLNDSERSKLYEGVLLFQKILNALDTL